MIVLSNLLELNKGEKMVASGSVTGGNINKLKKSGVMRSEKTYMKGIDKGSAFKLKGTGTKIRKSRLADLTGPIAIPQDVGPLDKGIMVPKGGALPFRTVLGIKSRQFVTKKDLKKEGPLFRRHEVDEMSTKRKVPRAIQFKKDGKLVGQHLSPGVIKKEKDLTDFTTKAYGVGKKLSGFRKKTGEYNMIDKMSGRKIRKIESRADKHSEKASTKMTKTIGDMAGATGIRDKIKSYRKLRKAAANVPYQVDVDKV